jgi:hypothetical protein
MKPAWNWERLWKSGATTTGRYSGPPLDWSGWVPPPPRPDRLGYVIYCIRATIRSLVVAGVAALICIVAWQPVPRLLDMPLARISIGELCELIFLGVVLLIAGGSAVFGLVNALGAFGSMFDTPPPPQWDGWS